MSEDVCTNCGKRDGGAVCGDCDGATEAELRGELKGLEWVLCDAGRVSESTIRRTQARIAELKKGGMGE